MLLLYFHRHMVNCYHFNISKIIFLTLSDARMCVPVYIPFSLAHSSTGVAWDSLLCLLNRKATASRALRNPRILFSVLGLRIRLIYFSKISTKQTNLIGSREKERKRIQLFDEMTRKHNTWSYLNKSILNNRY